MPQIPQNIMHVRLSVSITNSNYGLNAGTLNLNHEFTAREMDFGEIAELLARYDHLSKIIESEKKP